MCREPRTASSGMTTARPALVGRFSELIGIIDVFNASNINIARHSMDYRHKKGLRQEAKRIAPGDAAPAEQGTRGIPPNTNLRLR